MDRMTTRFDTGDAGETGRRRGKMGRAKDRLDEASRGRWALPFLFLGSVLESTVFPWPVEFPMIAYMLRGKRATVEAVTICVLGSVVGSALFYFAGRAAFEAVEGFVMARPDLESSLRTAQAWIEEWGPLAVGFATLAPIPVQMASLAAGLSEMAVWSFLLAVAAGRAIRYWAIGILILFFGERIVAWWENQPKARKSWGLAIATVIFLALLAWGGISLFTPG